MTDHHPDAAEVIAHALAVEWCCDECVPDSITTTTPLAVAAIDALSTEGLSVVSTAERDNLLAENDKMREIIMRAERTAHVASLFKGGYGDRDFVIGMIEWVMRSDRTDNEHERLSRMIAKFTDDEIEQRFGALTDEDRAMLAEAREDYG